MVLPGEEQGSDLGGRVGVRGCSMGDEGGDAAVVAENGSVVAAAIEDSIRSNRVQNGLLYRYRYSIDIDVRVLIRGVGRSHRVQMAKEQRNSKKERERRS